jgi:hypothetical protein
MFVLPVLVAPRDVRGVNTVIRRVLKNKTNMAWLFSKLLTLTALLAALVSIEVSSGMDVNTAIIKRLVRKVDTLTMDMIDMRVNLGEERQLREELETRLREIDAKTSVLNDNVLTDKSVASNDVDNSQCMCDVETITADLTQEQTRRGEMESQFVTFRSQSTMVTAMLRRALSTEKRNRHKVEKYAKRLGEFQSQFESTMRQELTNVKETIEDGNSAIHQDLTNVKDTIQEEKQIHRQTLGEWSEVVVRLEESVAGISRSVCSVAGGPAMAVCVSPKSDQTGTY